MALEADPKLILNRLFLSRTKGHEIPHFHRAKTPSHSRLKAEPLTQEVFLAAHRSPGCAGAGAVWWAPAIPVPCAPLPNIPFPAASPLVCQLPRCNQGEVCVERAHQICSSNSQGIGPAKHRVGSSRTWTLPTIAKRVDGRFSIILTFVHIIEAR